MSTEQPFRLEIAGYCPICEHDAVFIAKGQWLRGTLFCQSCENGSTPRERAFALVLNEMFPQWREQRIHESSPINRGISAKIFRQAKNLLRSQYYHDSPLGEYRDGFRNEDLQKLTLADDSFDLFFSLDVFEHIPEPALATEEIYRTLKPGGAMLCTFPVRKYQVTDMEYRARIKADGSIIHLKDPEYHGNPVSSDGSLVTVDYGYDIHQLIAKWAPFDVRVYRFCDRLHGILGEYTEVFLCKKRA